MKNVCLFLHSVSMVTQFFQMMKLVSSLTVFYVLIECSVAQTYYTTSNWTWITGASTTGAASTYGTLRVENSANTPSARYSHVMAFNPNANTILLFAGQTTIYFNDLWQYNVTSGNWAWISGSSSSDQLCTYGTKGVEASSNVPGGRSGSMGAFDPLTNSLYVFGGDGRAATTTVGRLSDLWRYRISTGQWTWVSGNNAINIAGVYGTLGQESSSNYPGGRSTGAMVFHQASYSLYMYGGSGHAATVSDTLLGDFWRYNLSSGNWAALPLSQTTGNVGGTYNTIRVESSTTCPNSRLYPAMIATNTDDTIWFFGGTQPISGNPLNDLFRYNLTSQRWTWMSGSTSANSAGSYGTVHLESSTNSPMARAGHVLQYHAPSNCLVLVAGNTASGGLMDTWRYNLTSGQWALTFGSNTLNQSPSYGTRLVSNPSNHPGARQILSSTISPLNGALYMFGGLVPSSVYRNDLWMYDIGPPPVVSVVSSTTTTTSSSTTSTTSSSTLTTTSSTTTISSSSLITDLPSLSSSSVITSDSPVPTSPDSSRSSSTFSSTLTASVRTTVRTTSGTTTPTGDAPNGSAISSTIIYASAGGGGALVLIAVVVAIVLVRRRSSSKPSGMQPTAQQGFPGYQPYTNSGMTMQPNNILNGTTQSVYGSPQSMMMQNPLISTMNRASMYAQPMTIPQQAINTNGYLDNSMNTNMNFGNPMNYSQIVVNTNTGMSYSAQQPMMQSPVVNNGQGAGTIIVDDNDNQMNYNQFSY